jgi:signal transduction histidine kinase
VPDSTAILRAARGGRRTAAAQSPLAIGTALQWAVLVAIGMSTQYLFQPFVWQNWPVADVLLGWVEVVRDRLVVALAIAAAVILGTRVMPSRASARAAIVAVTIVVGAAAGEVALQAIGSPMARADAVAFAGAVIQWTGLAMCAAGTYFLWLRHRDAREASRAQEIQRSNAESARVQTELESLRQQIEPHFLFNTLATIRHLREASPDEGRRLLGHLRRYLQSARPVPSRPSTLGDEVDMVASYLSIVAVRMSGRLTLDVEVPEAIRGCEFPSLALATLAENAVRHGITPSADGGSIAVTAKRDGNVLEVSVADTGVGLGEPAAAAIGSPGIGLASTRVLLRSLYGPAGTLRVGANDPRGVRAVIRVPFRTRVA